VVGLVAAKTEETDDLAAGGVLLRRQSQEIRDTVADIGNGTVTAGKSGRRHQPKRHQGYCGNGQMSEQTMRFGQERHPALRFMYVPALPAGGIVGLKLVGIPSRTA